jgi:hypothetical protein
MAKKDLLDEMFKEPESETKKSKTKKEVEVKEEVAQLSEIKNEEPIKVLSDEEFKEKAKDLKPVGLNVTKGDEFFLVTVPVDHPILFERRRKDNLSKIIVFGVLTAGLALLLLPTVLSKKAKTPKEKNKLKTNIYRFYEGYFTVQYVDPNKPENRPAAYGYGYTPGKQHLDYIRNEDSRDLLALLIYTGTLNGAPQHARVEIPRDCIENIDGLIKLIQSTGKVGYKLTNKKKGA